MHAVGQNRRHAAGVGRHDRAAARKGFEHGRRHVVDVGRLQVDVGVGVVPPHVGRRHAAGEAHVAQAEIRGELPERRRPASRRPTSTSVASGWRSWTSGTRAACTRRCRAARNSAWTARAGGADSAAGTRSGRRSTMFGNHLGRDAEPGEHVVQEPRRDRVAIDRPQRGARDAGPLQVVRRLRRCGSSSPRASRGAARRAPPAAGRAETRNTRPRRRGRCRRGGARGAGAAST